MGNRLVSVSDEGRQQLGADLFGFSDGTEEEIEYEYDENGNTMKDLNRKISSIQYNSLNLRQRREDGLHLSKEHALCLRFAPSLHQEICGNVLYDNVRSSECRPCLHEVCRVVTDEDKVNGNLDKVFVDGGYATLNATTGLPYI